MLESPRWSTQVRGEILERSALPDVIPAWESLCARAAEDNVYYSPRYAQALLGTVDAEREVRFAAAWAGSELIGFLPFCAPKLHLPYLRRVGEAWIGPYTFSCMPLVDAARGSDAASGLLDALGAAGVSEWIIPFVNVRGAACQAMLRALERRGVASAFVGSFQRASLSATHGFDEHMQHCVPARRRKELARTRRRLEALGCVEHHVHHSGEGLSAAVEAFLQIETRGWKGERRTAMACDARSCEFARTVFNGSERDSICRADVLTLDGTPIAVSLAVSAGSTVFSVKCTYDESYRRFSPGLLLEIEIMRSFLNEGWAARLDAATAGSHVIDSLWPGRVEVADLAFSLDPAAGQRRLANFQLCDGWKRRVKARVRDLIG
jgi:CelD/BcsL family acetyltransferase involved in cellulose biosynthesis